MTAPILPGLPGSPESQRYIDQFMAGARRLAESSDPAEAARGRAMVTLSPALQTWFDTEFLARSDPNHLLLAFCEVIGYSIASMAFAVSNGRSKAPIVRAKILAGIRREMNLAAPNVLIEQPAAAEGGLKP